MNSVRIKRNVKSSTELLKAAFAELTDENLRVRNASIWTNGWPLACACVRSLKQCKNRFVFDRRSQTDVWAKQNLEEKDTEPI